MKNKMIAASKFCLYHNIELSFLYSLNELELIKIITINKKTFVPYSQIKDVEKLIRLKQEMDINIEGIHSIAILLKKIDTMQNQIILISKRLSFYEND